MNRRLAALAVAVVGFAVGCSSTSSSGGTVVGSTTTIASTASTTTSIAVTTTAPAASTTVLATVPPTAAPAPPVTNAPKPPSSTAAPAPAPPRLDSVSLKTPVPSCNPGDVLTLTIEFSGTDMAAVAVYSSFDGDLGQFPAEYGSVDVPYTCISGTAYYTFTPVANGGAKGTPVNLSV
ncbi:MAG: hypothetical protein ABMA25_08305 [Ilumatobacteraceae bacterium]